METKNSNKQNAYNAEMVKEKPSFVFYRSYFEAIGTLSKKNRLIAYEAIAKYGLDREETEDLPLNVLAIIKMAIPNINSNHEKYYKKIKGTSQTNQKDTSVPLGEESKGEVSLPKKEYKNISPENIPIDEELESILNECLSISEQNKQVNP